MKKGLVSKILSGGLAAAVVFGSFSPSVFADRDRSLYYALDDEEPSIEKLERVLEAHDYTEFMDNMDTPQLSFSPLKHAIQGELPLYVFKWLFDHEKIILQKPNNAEYRNIIWSSVISQKNLPFLEFLFEAGAISEEDLNRSHRFGDTLLHTAAYYGWLDGVRLLYKHGAYVNITDEFGITPVYFAVSNGYVDVVKFLVEECHADFNIADKYGYTAVSIAVRKGDLRIVKWFIENGYVKLDYRDGNGRSLLKAATTQDDWYPSRTPEKMAEVVAYLESKGAVE